MAMLPSRVKHRKQQTRRNNPNHLAQCCNRLAFGDYGIQALEPGRLTARQIEAARVAAGHYLGKNGKLWIRVFPHNPITAHPAESRMGSGKGDVDHWATWIDRGTVMFELAGVTELQAREAMRRQAHKLPLATRLLKRS